MANKKTQKIIEIYQCPGCVCGSDTTCYKQGAYLECEKHVAGTNVFPGIGRILSGMPTGFNRYGQYKDMELCIFSYLKDGWGYDKYNIPAWKYFDKKTGCTIVRGMSPRTNATWIHIFIENCIQDISCYEITDQDISEMD